MNILKSHKELDVYKLAFWTSMVIFRLTKTLPKEAEAAETQVWIDYMLECEYISSQLHEKLFNEYENIIGKLVRMMTHPEKWSL